MCEVEFWEVFLSNKVRGFLISGALCPLVDCRLADLARLASAPYQSKLGKADFGLLLLRQRVVIDSGAHFAVLNCTSTFRSSSLPPRCTQAQSPYYVSYGSCVLAYL